MKIIILLITAILFFSCGSEYHLNKMKYHEMKAISKGAVIKNDTTYALREFTFPKLQVKFEPKLVRPEDRYEPIILWRDSIRTEIQWRKGKDNIDTVFVETDIPERKVKEEVPISVDKKIGPSSKRHWPWILLVGIIIGATGTILIVRKLSISIHSK